MAANIIAINFRSLFLITSAGNNMDRCGSDQIKIRIEIVVKVSPVTLENNL